jgi:NADPH-dependent curcumin reductase CurA
MPSTHTPTARSNRRIVIACLPRDKLTTAHFRLESSPLPRTRPGEVLCRTILVSLDPIARGLMRGGGDYRNALNVGEVMPGFGIAEVVDPGETSVAAGALVLGEIGWQQYATVRADTLSPAASAASLTHSLGVLGLTGMTAYFGLLRVGCPRPGETVVVSAAAGATGNVVGQLARIHGCHVVGLVGAAAKAVALAPLGFDACVERGARGLRRALQEHCPNGIDVFFDGVGGAVLDACLPLMNRHGRIVCCGVLSQYDAELSPVGPRAVPGLLIEKRLRMEGFVVLDYLAEWPDAQARMARWVESGDLAVLEEVIEGLESAPAAFVGLLAGDNVGKRMVRVAPDPAR